MKHDGRIINIIKVQPRALKIFPSEFNFQRRFQSKHFYKKEEEEQEQEQEQEQEEKRKRKKKKENLLIHN